VQFDATAKRVCRELLRFRGLALAAKRMIHRRPMLRRVCWPKKFFLARHCQIVTTIEQWLLRLRLLCQHCPELDLPPITEEDRKHIIEQLATAR
jgi:hypothetical protein